MFIFSSFIIRIEKKSSGSHLRSWNQTTFDFVEEKYDLIDYQTSCQLFSFDQQTAATITLLFKHLNFL